LILINIVIFDHHFRSWENIHGEKPVDFSSLTNSGARQPRPLFGG